MGCAFVFSLAIGVTAGIISAVRQYSWLDYTVTTLAFFGQSMPVFWFALMMQLAFSVVGITAFGYHILAAVRGHLALPTTSISATASST